VSYMDKGSRSASNEDVCPCPKCEQKDNIVVKWDRTEGDEVIQVGCEKCDNYVTTQNWSLAYVEWNIRAFDEKGSSGDHEREHIYRLLHRKFLMQEEIKNIDRQIDDFVTSTYMPRFRLKVGDRFETLERTPGKWEIVDVRAEYGINTGQFYIVKVVELSPNGRTGRRITEFWSDKVGKIRLLDNFVTATKWSMLRKGDACKLAGVTGKILEVDLKRRKAIVETEEGKVKINNLESLEVDKCRLT